MYLCKIVIERLLISLRSPLLLPSSEPSLKARKLNMTLSSLFAARALCVIQVQ